MMEQLPQPTIASVSTPIVRPTARANQHNNIRMPALAGIHGITPFRGELLLRSSGCLTRRSQFCG